MADKKESERGGGVSGRGAGKHRPHEAIRAGEGGGDGPVDSQRLSGEGLYTLAAFV